nr:immunoglobulin light chain junction region [Macaca mulatta]
YCQYNSYPLTF